MISLNIQLKLIIFSFIFGFLFSIILDYFNNKIKKQSIVIQIILSFLLIGFMAYMYFLGIQKIGYAIFHIYSVLSIIIGFFSYDFIIARIANKTKK